MLIIDSIVTDSVGGAILADRERRQVIARIAERKMLQSVDQTSTRRALAKAAERDKAKAWEIYRSMRDAYIGTGETEQTAHQLALFAVWKAGRLDALGLPRVKPTGADRRAGLEVGD